MTRNPVLLNSLNSMQKVIKCWACLAFYLFSSSCLFYSIKHEQPCKEHNILYHDYEDDEDTFLKYRSCILADICVFYSSSHADSSVGIRN